MVPLLPNTQTHRQLTKISGDVLWLARFICFDAAAIASVMLVRFATESKWTPEIDWSDHARKRLTFGDISPTKVKLLVKLALDQNTLSGIPEPTYTDEIIAAIKLLIERQEIAIHVPNMIDLTLSKISNGQASPEVLPGVNTALVPQIDATSKRILSAIGFAADLGPDWIKPTAAVAEQSSGSLPASHSSA